MTLRRTRTGSSWCSHLLGLLLVTAGHAGPLAGLVRRRWSATALDGVLAPLRNVHKFDPVIRLPLVLGLAHLLGRWRARAAAAGRGADVRRAAGRLGSASPTPASCCCASSRSPARPARRSTGRLGPANDFEAVPGYWPRTAAWLDEQLGRHRPPLLVPGSSFGFYLWGDADDEPLQPLGVLALGGAQRRAARARRATSGCSTRSRPSSPPGGRRPGWRGYLRRAGIGHLVVRNDLRATSTSPRRCWSTRRSTAPRASSGSPSSGPRSGGPGAAQRASGATRSSTTGLDATATRPWRSTRCSGATARSSRTGSPLVVGGPEDLLDLTEAGLLGDEPAVLAVDAAEPDAERRRRCC